MWQSLRDRVGVEHPLKADIGCRNTVFHALAQTGAEYVSRMQGLGVRSFRVEFVNESPEQVKQVITRYRQLLRGEHSLFLNGSLRAVRFDFSPIASGRWTHIDDRAQKRSHGVERHDWPNDR